MIVLVGFMGAGKTTVGELVAHGLGLPFIDTDHVIEAAERSSVAEIFTRAGEARFRALEKTAVEDALGGPPTVVAVGGGALGDPSVCSALEWHTIVHLDVSYPEAMHRIGADPGRPMLTIEDPRALYERRRSTYERVARHTVSTDGLSPDEVAKHVIAAAGTVIDGGPPRIEVLLGDRSYGVFVGADLSRDVTRFFDPGTAAQAFVVTHPGLVDAAKPVVDSLAAAGLETTVLPVDDGEASKSLPVAGELLEALTASKANRSDLVVSFGGGVISDLAGFVASIYHRGMLVVHVPTSLLGQVDAAIGGKTAVNLPQGKNLAGTIHQPLAVICDVSLLRALPPEELRAGMAEVIKCALVADSKLADVIRTGMAGISDRDEDTMTEVVRRAAGVKAAIVSADERDLGAREVLNYGHTFGHALEHVTHMRHGEAIAVGMMAEAHLAAGLGMLSAADVEVHRALLDVVGLPVAAAFETGEVLEALEHDKKHRGEVRFVLLGGIGVPQRGITATREQMVDALRKVAR